MYTSFYTIQKLTEAKKISDAIVNRSVPLTAYPAKGKPVHRLNRHRFDELYDCNAPRRENRPMAFVWNQMIHSYIFTPVFAEEVGLQGFLFCSDRTRHTFLYELGATELIALFEEVGNNYPASIRVEFEPKTPDWEVKVGPLSLSRMMPNNPL